MGNDGEALSSALMKVILVLKLIADDSKRKQGEKWNPFYENIT